MRIRMVLTTAVLAVAMLLAVLAIRARLASSQTAEKQSPPASTRADSTAGASVKAVSAAPAARPSPL